MHEKEVEELILLFKIIDWWEENRYLRGSPNPNDYAGKYKSIFIVDFVIMPQANYETVDIRSGQAIKEWVFDPVDISTALNSIYEICLDMKANAIINFEISPYTDTYGNVSNPAIIVGKRISGMAI